MLKLIRCEFLKIKRKKLFRIAFLTTFIMPVFYFMIIKEATLDNLMSVVQEENGFLVLIPLSIVLAANLFFEEQDHDTLKNLLCIPVTKSRLALAKLFVILLFDLAYELAGFLVSLLLALFSDVPLNGLGQHADLHAGLIHSDRGLPDQQGVYRRHSEKYPDRSCLLAEISLRETGFHGYSGGTLRHLQSDCHRAHQRPCPSPRYPFCRLSQGSSSDDCPFGLRLYRRFAAYRLLQQETRTVYVRFGGILSGRVLRPVLQGGAATEYLSLLGGSDCDRL